MTEYLATLAAADAFINDTCATVPKIFVYFAVYTLLSAGVGTAP